MGDEMLLTEGWFRLKLQWSRQLVSIAWITASNTDSSISSWTGRLFPLWPKITSYGSGRLFSSGGYPALPVHFGGSWSFCYLHTETARPTRRDFQIKEVEDEAEANRSQAFSASSASHLATHSFRLYAVSSLAANEWTWSVSMANGQSRWMGACVCAQLFNESGGC